MCRIFLFLYLKGMYASSSSELYRPVSQLRAASRTVPPPPPGSFKLTFRLISYRKLVEQTMLEHENTKEARKKLQEYKQKLGKTKMLCWLIRSYL